MTPYQKDGVKHYLEQCKEFHHGDCIGSDAQAHEIAQAFGCKIVIHPPINPSKRAFCKGEITILEPRQYLDRNHDIVDACETLIATPKTSEEELRSGTWATIRYARKTGKNVIVLHP